MSSSQLHDFPSILTIKQVNIYSRHGERSPVRVRMESVFPARWNLCKIGRQFDAAVLDSTGSRANLRIQRVVEDGEGQKALDGECLLGELTDKGRQTTLQLGMNLRKRYVEELRLVPAIPDHQSLYFRSTNMSRTIESLQQVVTGLYPSKYRPPSWIPNILIRNMTEENLLPNTLSCARLRHLDKAFAKAAAAAYNDTLVPLDPILSKFIDGKPVRVDGSPAASGLMDTVRAAESNGMKVPEEFNVPEVRNTLENAICAEWFDGYKNHEFKRLAMGRLFGDLKKNIEGTQAGKPLKMAIMSCHDTTLAAILASLDVFDNKWPDFTAHVSVEVFSTPALSQSIISSFIRRPKQQGYVRINYNNNPLKIPACAGEADHLPGHPTFCTMEAFTKTLDELIPKNWVEECTEKKVGLLPLLPNEDLTQSLRLLWSSRAKLGIENEIVSSTNAPSSQQQQQPSNQKAKHQQSNPQENPSRDWFKVGLPMALVIAAFARGLGLTSSPAALPGMDDVSGNPVDKIRVLVFWLIAFVLTVALAFVTNPSEASFRSHLTELSFRRHLRELNRSGSSSSCSNGELDHFPSLASQTKQQQQQGLNSSSNKSHRSSSSVTQNGHSSSTIPLHNDTAPRAASDGSPHRSNLVPFRFGNRVSISLRTPRYSFKDLGIFSIVVVASNQDGACSTTAKKGINHRRAKPLNRLHPDSLEDDDGVLSGVWFFGMFGKWWIASAGGHMFGLDPSNLKGDDEISGILSIKSLDPVEDIKGKSPRKNSDLESAVSSLFPSALSNLSPSSALSNPRSRRPSVDDGTVESILVPDLPHVSPLRQQTTVPVPSEEPEPLLDHTNIPRLSADILAGNPVLTELTASLEASNAANNDLRSQLAQVTLTANSHHSQLQTTLDDLRLKKKEEDAERLDIKSRTKTLEDGRRQAEVLKKEADKKLKLSESTRDAILARIEVLEKEIECKKEKAQKHQREGAESNATVTTKREEMVELRKQKEKEIMEKEHLVVQLADASRGLAVRLHDEEIKLERAKDAALANLEAREVLRASTKTNPAFDPFGPSSIMATANDYPQYLGPLNTKALFDLPAPQPSVLQQRRRQAPEFNLLNVSTDGSSHVQPSFSSNDVFGFQESRSSAEPHMKYHSSEPTNLRNYSHYPEPHHLARQVSQDGFSSEDELGSPAMSASFTANLLPSGLFHSLEGESNSFDQMEPPSPYTALYSRSLGQTSSLNLCDDEDDENPHGSVPSNPSRRPSVLENDIFFPAEDHYVKEQHPETEQLHHQHPLSRPSSGSHASPRSVLSDDPRSYLLDPYEEALQHASMEAIKEHSNESGLLDYTGHAVMSKDVEDEGHQSAEATTGDFGSPHLGDSSHDDEEVYSAGLSPVSSRQDGVDADEKSPSKFAPKRWFSKGEHGNSPKSQVYMDLEDLKLNPDARAFSLKGLSALGRSHRTASNPSSMTNVNHMSDLSISSQPFVPSRTVSNESLLLPPIAGFPDASASNATRFFSSLRAFAPSASEREQLSRALRSTNGSRTSIDHPPSPPYRSSSPTLVVPMHIPTSHVHQFSTSPPQWSAPAEVSRRKSFRFFSLGSSFGRNRGYLEGGEVDMTGSPTIETNEFAPSWKEAKEKASISLNGEGVKGE